MKIGMISFTARGAQVCYDLCRRFEKAGEECIGYVPPRCMKGEWEGRGILPRECSLSAWTGDMFGQKRALVFIGAAGIAVRAIAPFVRDKMTDPPVVVIDEGGRFCIPVLSGHVGGANELAVRMAAWLHAVPVITTATDVNGVFAVDVFASGNGLAVTDRREAKNISARLLEGEKVGYFNDMGDVPGYDWPVPEGCAEEVCPHNIWVTVRGGGTPGKMSGRIPAGMPEGGTPQGGTPQGGMPAVASAPAFLRLVPGAVVIGLGCRKDTLPSVMERLVLKALDQAGIDRLAVKAAATIDIKAGEAAVTELAQKYGWEIRTYTSEALSQVQGLFHESEFVRKTVGVGNVCERACTAEGGTLLLHKQAGEGVTVALALEGNRAVQNQETGRSQIRH